MTFRTRDVSGGPFDTTENLRRVSDEPGKVETIKARINNPAATREAIIVTLRRSGIAFQERSQWKAKAEDPARSDGPDWDYTCLVLHHAGNSYSCNADDLDQLRRVEATDMTKFGYMSYHYAISCTGTIYEARDIRFKGSHVSKGNTGRIGIVLLNDFSDPGEAYEEEYKEKSRLERLKNAPELVRDRVDAGANPPPPVQVRSLAQLVYTLKSYFPIRMLGGHREFQRLANHEGRACPGRLGMAVVDALRAEFRLEAPQ
ncbi:peptidoglycan recognition protein family protein [Lysobacter auxotrophicus]|uniref:Peptidoglycan recognition protein family protein n=1 Tax=Lysobacter auxotrophicus TaxID=2992573 RepID=A0ABM8DI62_9GAMM|nr:peptidoglycan recognition family protein [Lysobacter auxotrophicus]BDU18273.1 peptidoglycan recognition protein family protein [Lysobacter auxotrophicus]